ncbi:MAG: transcriptional regulator [Rhodospirillales bacterium]
MASPKVQIIQPSGDLRKRAVNFKTGFGVVLSAGETQKLQNVVEKSSEKFVRDIGATLRKLREDLAALPEGEVLTRDMLARVGNDAIDIKGLGGTFRFPLLTQITKSLHDYVLQIKTPSAWNAVIVGHHIDALYVVLAQRITGFGGQIESELLAALRAASAKYK